jgi:hypothetical protein
MRFSRKQFVAVAAGTLTLGLGVGAFAYFQAPGGGVGSASVGSASPITLSATTAGVLYPGGPARPVTITVTNPGGGAQRVDTVSLTSVDTPAGCAADAFSMPAVTVDTTLAAGASTTVVGSLTMADSGDQDACQNGSLVLNLASN